MMMSKSIKGAYGKEKPLFLLFFSKRNENESTQVVEVREIDFTEVKKHIERGESVFITQKREERLKVKQIANQKVTEPWYFTRA